MSHAALATRDLPPRAQDVPALLTRYERDGFLVIPGCLSLQEVQALRAGAEQVFAQPCAEAKIHGPKMEQVWRPKMFEHGQPFEDLVDHPAVAGLVEAILGQDCHLIANSALRTGPGLGLTGWHADDQPKFPIPEGAELDPRISMPTYILNLHYYLSDVDAELGPTEFIPGSHRSGRQPGPGDIGADGDPLYHGRSKVQALGSAGTCVMWHDGIWHQGGPNRRANRTRWAIQTPFGRRYMAQRFYPFMNYCVPQGVIDRATPRRLRLLGKHVVGSYG